MHTRLNPGFLVALVLAVAGMALAAEKAAPVSVPKLPTFKEGKWKGAYVAYTHQNFDAIIDENSVLTIYPKGSDGKRVGRPFTCYQLSCYYVPPKGHQHGRPPISFENPGQPQEQPRKVSIKGILKDDVPFQLEYEFANNQITAAGGCADPSGIQYPTVFRILSQMASSHSIPPQMEQPDREKLLKTCRLVTRERVGGPEGRKKRFEYPYWDIMRFHGHIEYAEVKGPYGPRVIKMRTRNEEGTLYGYIYSDCCPWQGYSIYYTTQSKEIDLFHNKVLMLIE